RVATTPEALVPAVRRSVAALDPNVPIYEVRTMEDLLASTIAAPRLAAVLSGSFAVIAMLLAVIGIYGVTAHLVAPRPGEMGVRMAWGAPPAAVVRMVVAQAMWLATGGVG